MSWSPLDVLYGLDGLGELPLQYSRYSILPPLDGVRRGVRWYMVFRYKWSLGEMAMVMEMVVKMLWLVE